VRGQTFGGLPAGRQGAKLVLQVGIYDPGFKDLSDISGQWVLRIGNPTKRPQTSRDKRQVFWKRIMIETIKKLRQEVDRLEPELLSRK
jgi:hypothetical protein